MASTVQKRQWVFLGAALLLIGSVIGWNLYTYRNAIEAGEREHLAHQARVIEENLSKQLLATNRALESIRRDLPLLKAQKDSKVLINSRLQAMSDTMPGVRTLFIFDADATVIASNRKELIGLNFREREYYKTARQSRNPAILHLSQPYKTVLGAFAMTLVKVIPGKRGEVAGMVGATIDPEYFKTLLNSVRYAPDMWTSLAHGDGKLFLFVPERPGTEGTSLAQPGGLFIRHRDSGQMATVMTGLVLVTGEERMIAQRTIKPADVLMDKVIFVAVARDLPTIFVVWRRSAVVESGVFGLLVLITALGLYLYQKSQRAYERIGANQETERKKTEEALRESEEQYRTVVSSADAGIIFQENIGIIRTWNTAAERIFGISAEEALGQTSTSRDWKTYREDGSELKGAEHPSMHTLATGEPCRNIVMKVVRATGGFSWINVNTSPIFKDGDSKPSAVVITFSDISERKQAEEKLQDSEKQLQLAQQIGHAGSWSYNLETGKIWGSAEGFRIYGFPPIAGDFSLFDIEACIPERERVHQALVDLINEGREYDLECVINPADGSPSKMIHSIARLEKDAQGKPFKVMGFVQDITNRKRMEEELKLSEARLTEAQAVAKIGSWETDLLNMKVIWSEETYRIFEIDPGRFQSSHPGFLEFVHPEDRAKVDAAFAESIGKETLNAIEHRIITPSGLVKFIEERWRIIHDGQGLPVRAVGTCQDITDRKRADEKLRESEERLRLAIQAANQGLYDLNVQTGATIVNREYAQMLGYDPETFIETNAFWIERLHPDDHEITAKAYSDYVNGLTSEYRIEFRQKTIGGHWKWLLSLGKIVGHDADGKPLRMLGTHTDITERKQVEQALQESETKYRLLLRNIRIAVIVHGSDTRILISNPMAQELLGLTENQMLGKTVIDPDWHFLHEDSSIMPLEEYPVNKTLTERRSLKDLIVGIHRTDRDALTWVLVNTEPTLNEQGAIDEVIVTFLDITDRKQAEAEKRNIEERLQNIEKMESIGTLAGGVAHDLNNMLGALIGHAELLKGDMKKSDPLYNSVENIMTAGQKAAMVVQDLLTMARRGVILKEPASLNKIVADHLRSSEIRNMLDATDVNLKTQYDRDLLHINASAIHIERILVNLISNALRAIRGGDGTILIRTENRYLETPVMGHETVPKGEYAVLTVSDTGIGIFPKHMKNLFEPFYMRKVLKKGGSGLGLSVIWGAMKDHDGYIDVTSELGEGTTFSLYFPVTRDDSVRFVEHAVEEYQGYGETILVVDDEDVQCIVAAKMLTRLNYVVKTVESGEEALEYLADHDVDLVVLDMIMEPGMDGYDTYRSILEIKKRQKAIIFSGFTKTERVKMAQDLGAGEFIMKPYLMERLGTAVRQELDKK